jgi:hypothetical protein
MERGESASAHSVARRAERSHGTRIACAVGVTIRTPRDATISQPTGKSLRTRKGESKRVKMSPSLEVELMAPAGPIRFTTPLRLRGL